MHGVGCTQIAVGYREDCGITTDGGVRCWGIYGDCQNVDGECTERYRMAGAGG